MGKELELEIEVCLEEIWQLAAKIFNLNPEYQKDVLKIQTLVSIMSNQPERSKREDSPCSNCFELEKACGNCFSQDGICPKCGRLVRCGALNSMET